MKSSLDQLEHEVERARVRLTQDLARFRDPATLAIAGEELLTQARDYKNEAIDRLRHQASESARSLLDEARLRAQRNPAAILVMGAGLAWMFLRKPPIASLLIAAGAASLINTPKEDADSTMSASSAFGALRKSAKLQAARISAMVQDAPRRASEQAPCHEEQARDSVVKTTEIAAVANEVAAQIAVATNLALDYASDATRQARKQIRKNPIYFGAAALAIGATLGLSLGRSGPPASEP